jgi:hypothetical protein
LNLSNKTTFISEPTHFNPEAGGMLLRNVDVRL